MDFTAAMNPLAIAPASNAGGANSVTIGGSQLDESDFLMLLVAELMNQDPLDPMSERDFIAQMAQLNTLNETMTLNENIRTMQMLQATSLVGRDVEAIGSQGGHVEGAVTEVWFIDSEAWLVIDEEILVSLKDVARIL